MIRRLAIIVALAVAFFAGRLGRRESTVYQRVIVPQETIREVERVDTVVSFRERIVFRTIPPVQTALARAGAGDDVARFCAPSVLTAISDTVTPTPPPTLLLRSIRTEAGWFWRPDEAVLTGPLSNTDLWQARYSVRPGWQASVMADSVLMQSPRWWWIREAIELGVPFLLGRVSAGKLP